MTAVRNFTDLYFWQRARQWSKNIFKLTGRKPFCNDHRLVAQINDSSESVHANIAEQPFLVFEVGDFRDRDLPRHPGTLP